MKNVIVFRRTSVLVKTLTEILIKKKASKQKLLLEKKRSYKNRIILV